MLCCETVVVSVMKTVFTTHRVAPAEDVHACLLAFAVELVSVA